MRVLIIGCGYVGLPLGATLVQQGHVVFGLTRSQSRRSALEEAGLQSLVADITDPRKLESLQRDYDWVINCAATSGGGPQEYRAVYFEGTRNLIEWLIPNPPRKFIYTSSTSVYGQNDGSVVDEHSPANPEADTSKILVATENLLIDAWSKTNFPAVILRVAGIYGPGRGHAFKQFVSGQAVIAGAGNRWLNMIHCDDLVGVIIAALEKGRPGEIYNAVDDEPVTQRDFFQWLAASLNKPLPPSVPKPDTSPRKRGVTNKRISNQKLKTELGHPFLYPTFRQGYPTRNEIRAM